MLKVTEGQQPLAIADDRRNVCEVVIWQKILPPAPRRIIYRGMRYEKREREVSAKQALYAGRGRSAKQARQRRGAKQVPGRHPTAR